MIVSDNFLTKINSHITAKCFSVEACRIVSDWILDYYDEYSKAPKSTIEEIYKNRSKKLEEETSIWIKEFLKGISDRYEREGFNEDYLFDQAIKYFRIQLWKDRIDKLSKAADNNDLETIEDLYYSSLKDVEKGVDSIHRINPFSDYTIDDIYEFREEQSVFTTGIKALDKLLGGPLDKEWFVVFTGPPKRGKTFMLTWCAIRGVMLGRDVAFFSFEGGKYDTTTRMWMTAGSIVSNYSESNIVDFPYFLSDNESVLTKAYERPWLKDEVETRKLLKAFRKQNRGSIRAVCFPAYSAGMKEIKTELKRMEVVDKVIPSIIIVDYIGNMNAPGYVGRDVYNQNSQSLKALSQERKALVLSATQGTRITFEKQTIEVMDIPEDIRQVANVDVLLGLNQTADEYEEGIMRINVMIHRHAKWNSKKQAKVLQQLEAGQVALDSRIIDAPISDYGGKYKDFKGEADKAKN